jgi:hypothetical protein
MQSDKTVDLLGVFKTMEEAEDAKKGWNENPETKIPLQAMMVVKKAS